METSLFIQYVKKFFQGVVTGVVSKMNDSKNPLVYYHKRFLRPEYSVDGKWESVSAANTLVMADVVSMDSTLPLKKRDSISKASGDIPKMGMKLKLNEKQLTDLDTLQRRPGAEAQLVAKLFQDTPKVIGGIYERNEAIFLQALSSGVALVEDDETVGTGIRMDYQLPNTYGVATLWSNVAAKPIDDLNKVKKEALTKGDVLIKFLLDSTAFDNFVKTTQVKELYAFHIGFVGANIQIPSLDQVNAMLKGRYGFVLEIVERSVRYEKNGVQTVKNPWKTGAVVGITSEQLGLLTWATLAEVNHPVSGVSYETADSYILVSKFRTNEPLTEWTSSQARVVPVLTNTDHLYLIDSTTVEA
jgi:hypothetical protein